MADDEENGEVKALVTAEYMSYGGDVYIAAGGWAKAAKVLKTPVLRLRMETGQVERLCRASNGAWAWRDITAPDTVAQLRVIKGKPKLESPVRNT